MQFTALRRALSRLKATAGDQEVEVEAQFDGSKEQELKNLQAHLKRKGVIFRIERHYLFHKSNQHELDQEVQLVLEVLHQLEFDLRINPGILTKPRFALKSTQGLVLQRIEYNLRIFFSI
jgi:hypothetical protein